MVFLGYAEGTKAYRLYDPRRDKVTVSRDVVFNEEAAWDWHSPSMGEAGGFTNTFVVEHLSSTAVETLRNRCHTLREERRALRR